MTRIVGLAGLLLFLGGCSPAAPEQFCKLRSPLEITVQETRTIKVGNPLGCMVLIKVDGGGNVLERLESPDLINGMCRVCRGME